VTSLPAVADAGRIDFLLHAIANDAPEELEADPYEVMEADERRIALAAQVEREGQGTFRARLLDAYDGRCAITGEHTELVLDGKLTRITSRTSWYCKMGRRRGVAIPMPQRIVSRPYSRKWRSKAITSLMPSRSITVKLRASQNE
jgi:hypothetical protein